MPYDQPTVLDGTVPTLDAAELTYEFEKARIRGVQDDQLINEYHKTDKAIMSENFEYVDSFYDPSTGTSGAAFKDKNTDKVIIAYTGTNFGDEKINDALGADAVGIALGTGHHYGPAFQFYEDVLAKNGLSKDDVILTGHSLGGNVAQRVAIRYNAPQTVVYNSAPLYVPIGAGLGLSLGVGKNPNLYSLVLANTASIEDDLKHFDGNITRITTAHDPLNITSDLGGAVYAGEEYVIPNSGGHLTTDIRASITGVREVENATLKYDEIEKNTQSALNQVQTKKESLKVNDIGKGSPNGLSEEELIALDSEQAKIISGALTATSSVAVELLQGVIKKAVGAAKELYDTLDDVPPGFIMSPDEVKATYNDFGVNYSSIVGKVDNHYQNVYSKAQAIDTSFSDLKNKIDTGVDKLIERDQQIGALING